MRLRPSPSRRVKNAMVRAASSERPNESSNAESSVALMKRPPVLQRIAAPRTSSSGETVADWAAGLELPATDAVERRKKRTYLRRVRLNKTLVIDVECSRTILSFLVNEYVIISLEVAG